MLLACARYDARHACPDHSHCAAITVAGRGALPRGSAALAFDAKATANRYH